MKPILNKIRKALALVRSADYLRALWQHGTAAGAEHAPLLESLRGSGLNTIVDVGANRGQFALVARHCLPTARIISFEPLGEPAAVFQRIFANDHLVSLYQMAIGPDDKYVPMHVSIEDDASSLLPISELQLELFPHTLEKEMRTVPMKPLSAFVSERDLSPVALLKIDVQGFEKEVLIASGPLLPCFSYVFVECSFVELYTGQALAHELISTLGASGFVLRGVYNLIYDKKGIAMEGDFLFENQCQLTR